MLVDTLLAGLVVIRAYRQDGVVSGNVEAAHLLGNFRRIVAGDSSDQRHAPIGFIGGKLPNILPLRGGYRGGLASRAEGYQVIHAAVDLMGDLLAERIKIG